MGSRDAGEVGEAERRREYFSDKIDQLTGANTLTGPSPDARFLRDDVNRMIMDRPEELAAERANTGLLGGGIAGAALAKGLMGKKKKPAEDDTKVAARQPTDSRLSFRTGTPGSLSFTGKKTPLPPKKEEKKEEAKSASLRNFGAKVAAFNIGDFAKNIPAGLQKVMPAAGAGALGGAALGGLHGLIAPGHEDIYDDEGNVVGRQRRGRFGAALRGALGGGAAGGLAGGALEHFRPGTMGQAQDWLKSMYKGKQKPETSYAKELERAKAVPGAHLKFLGEDYSDPDANMVDAGLGGRIHSGHAGIQRGATNSPGYRENTRLREAFARGETPGSLEAARVQGNSPQGLEPNTPAPAPTAAEGRLQQQLGQESAVINAQKQLGIR
jgi:hypothetical protein